MGLHAVQGQGKGETRRGGTRGEGSLAEVRSQLLRLVRGGLPIETAARLAGVEELVVVGWRRRSRRFERELQQAFREGEAIHVAHISEAGRTNWRAAAWLLERMYPDKWGEPVRREDRGPSAPENELAGL